jgi:hypothetical protein
LPGGRSEQTQTISSISGAQARGSAGTQLEASATVRRTLSSFMGSFWENFRVSYAAANDRPA